MGSVKREWSPCKLCEHYYNESCDNLIKDECNWKPINDFIQFLTINNYRLNSFVKINVDKIYLVEKDFDISIIKEKDKLDLRNNTIDDIKYKLIYGVDFCHTFILPIDVEVRNFLYESKYIMERYDIKMVLSSKVKKSLKYRLDQRFKFIEFKDI